MSRLRKLVVAGWVAFAIAGPVLPATPLEAAVGAIDAIDATGDADVTADLQTLIDRTPDGGVVRLRERGAYRVEGTLVVQERHRLRIEGNGAHIFATTTGDGSRSHLKFVGGSDLVVRNLEIRGANPHAGVEPNAYVPDLEAQHGIRIEGATDVELDRVRVSDVHGDFVYLGRHLEDDRWTERVWVHDSTFTRSGRQGLTVIGGRDVVIEHNTITGARMATVDLEPHPSFGAENVHVLDNEIGPGRLGFVAATGRGRVNTVVIARNVLRGQPLTMIAQAPPGERRQSYWVVDNVSETPANRTPLRFTNIDGVVVTGNRQSVPRPGEALVEVVHSCGVSMARNDIHPGTLPFTVVGRSCGFDLPSTPPRAPAVAGRGRPSPASTPSTPNPAAEGSSSASTTATATTEAPGSTTTTSPPTTPSPVTETSRPPVESEAASATQDRGTGSTWIVVVPALLAAGAAVVVTISARRWRR